MSRKTRLSRTLLRGYTFLFFFAVSCSSKEEIMDIPLSLTQAIPSSGPSIGKQVIKLKGEQFQKNAQVYFAGKPAIVTQWNSPQELEVMLPENSGIFGFVEVKVVNPPAGEKPGEVTNNQIFSYTLSTINFPSSTVLIPLTDFELTNQFYSGFSIVSADFDGDQKPDLAAIGKGMYLGQYGTRLVVRLSGSNLNGSGVKPETVRQNIDDYVFTNLATTDADQDGRMDVVGVGHSVKRGSIDEISVLFSVTKDSISSIDKIHVAEGKKFQLPVHASSVVLADINQDGLLDAAISAIDKNEWDIIPGLSRENNSLRFGDPGVISFGSLRSTVSMVGVIDIQGVPNIVALNRENSLMQLFKRTGDFQFQPVLTPTPTTDQVPNPSPTAMAIADFNGDSLLDVAIANRNLDQRIHSIVLFYQTPQGTLEKGPVYSTGFDTLPMALATADFNGDRKADLLVVNQDLSGKLGVKNVSIYLQQESGLSPPSSFTYEVSGEKINPVSSDIPYPQSVVVADLNEDKKPDIAIADPRGWLVVLTNRSY